MFLALFFVVFPPLFIFTRWTSTPIQVVLITFPFSRPKIQSFWLFTHDPRFVFDEEIDFVVSSVDLIHLFSLCLVCPDSFFCPPIFSDCNDVRFDSRTATPIHP